MKKVEAIIRQAVYSEVKKALAKVGINFYTKYEVKGIGLQKGDTIKYRGSTVEPDYISRIQLEIVVPEDKVDITVKTIMDAARTGAVGDGKIFIHSIDKVYRIRTGEEQEDAL